MEFRREIADALSAEVLDIEPLGGGCVSAVYAVRLADDERVVAKCDERGTASLPVEGFMLRYLKERTSLPVPAVLYSSERLLLLEYLSGESQFSPEAERHAASLLAKLHGITAPMFGFEQDTLIGGLLQPNPACESWLDFFGEHRLGYMAREAERAGRLAGSIRDRVERLAERVDRWIVEPAAPALLHGDVWTTNMLASGDHITGFLDPAIYFGDLEIELAFTTLFNTFGPGFYERYDELRPIAPGFFEERRDLYNLYPLLVHVRLFGGSYVHSVERTLARFGH